MKQIITIEEINRQFMLSQKEIVPPDSNQQVTELKSKIVTLEEISHEFMESQRKICSLDPEKWQPSVQKTRIPTLEEISRTFMELQNKIVTFEADPKQVTESKSTVATLDGINRESVQSENAVPPDGIDQEPFSTDSESNSQITAGKGRKEKRISYFIVYLLISALLLVLFISGYLPKPDAIFGVRLFEITTSSMKPALSPKDIIVVVPISPDKIRKGDIITFQLSEKVTSITHRVVAVIFGYNDTGEYAFQTKGDHNNEKDGTIVRQNMIIGKTILVLPGMGPYINTIIFFSRVLLIVALLLIMFFLMQKKARSSGKREKHES